METLAVDATLTQLAEGALAVCKASRDVYTAYRSASKEMNGIGKQSDILRRILGEAATIHHQLQSEAALGKHFP